MTLPNGEAGLSPNIDLAFATTNDGSIPNQVTMTREKVEALLKQKMRQSDGWQQAHVAAFDGLSGNADTPLITRVIYTLIKALTTKGTRPTPATITIQDMLDELNNEQIQFLEKIIPVLDASKIGSGQFAQSMVENLTDALAALTTSTEIANNLIDLKSAAGANLMLNPNFSNMLIKRFPYSTGVTEGYTLERFRSGLSSWKWVQKANTNCGIYLAPTQAVDRFVVTEGEQFYLEAWLYQPATNNTFAGELRLGATFTDSSAQRAPQNSYAANLLSSPEAAPGGWRMMSKTVVVPAGYDSAQFYVYASNQTAANNVFFLDDVTVKEVTDARQAQAAADAAVNTANTAASTATAADGKAQNTIDSIVQSVDGGTTTGALPGATKTKLQQAWQKFWEGLTGSAATGTILPEGVKDAASGVRVQANLGVTNAGIADGKAVVAQTIGKDIRTAGANMIPNPGFENSTSYLSGTGTYSTAYARTGSRSVKLTANGTANQAVYLTTNGVDAFARVPCTPGDIFYVEAWVRGDPANTATTGQVYFGAEFNVGTVAAPSYTYLGVGTLTPAQVGTTAWHKVSGYFTAPANSITFLPMLLVQNNVASGNSFYWDDVIVREVTVARTATVNLQTTIDNIFQGIRGGTSTGNALDTVRTSLQTVWNSLWDGLNGSAGQTATNKFFTELFQAGAAVKSRAEQGVTNAGLADAKAVLAQNAITVRAKDFINIAAGSDFIGAVQPWTFETGWSLATDQKKSGLRSLKNVSHTLITAAILNNDALTEVQPGDQIYMELWARRSADCTTAGDGNAYRLRCVRDTGLSIDNVFFAPANLPVADTWVKLTNVVTIPDDGTTGVSFRLHGLPPGAPGSVWIDNIVIRRVVGNNIIAENAITTGKLKDGAVTTGKVVDNAITGAKTSGLDGSKITTGTVAESVIATLSASKIGSGLLDILRIPSLPAGQITSGTFLGDRIPGLDAGKIISGEFPQTRITNLVADLGSRLKATIFNARARAQHNMFPSPSFEDATILRLGYHTGAWDTTGYTTEVAASSGVRSWKWTVPSTVVWAGLRITPNETDSYFDVNPGDRFYMEAWVYIPSTNANTGSLYLGVHFGNNATSLPGGSKGMTLSTAPKNQWVKLSAYLAAPATANRAYFWILSDTSATANDVFYVDDVIVREVGESLDIKQGIFGQNTIQSSILSGVVPGLDAAKIVTGEFGTGRIADNAITGAKTSGLDGSKITTGTVAESVIATLSASKIGSGVLNVLRIPGLPASQITTGSFGSAFIGDGSITTGKIVDSAVTGAKTSGLDGSKITTGTIAESVIATLSASKIGSGLLDILRIPSLPAGQITTGTFAGSLIPGLDAAKITTGEFAQSRVTNLVTDFLKTNAVANAASIAGANLVTNPGFENPNFYASGGTWATDQVYSGTQSWKYTCTGSTSWTGPFTTSVSGAVKMQIKPNDVFYVEMMMFPAAGNAAGTTTGVMFYFRVEDKTGAQISTPSFYINTAAMTKGAWNKVTGYIVVDGNAANVTAMPTIAWYASEGTNTYHIDNPIMYRVTEAVETNKALFNSNTPLVNILSGVVPGLDAAKIVTGQFGTGRIEDNAITGAKTSGLDGSKITTGTIAESVIATLSASKIGSGLLDILRIPGLPTSKITTGTFGTAFIGDGAITTAKIQDGNVTGIKTAGLDASKITGGSMAQALVTNLTTDLTTIGGKATAAQAIGTANIASGSNLMPNPGFEDTSFYYGPNLVPNTNATYVRTGSRSIKTTANGVNYIGGGVITDNTKDVWVPCSPGDVFYMEVWVRADDANTATTGMVYFQFVGETAPATYSYVTAASSTTPAALKGGWTKLAGTVTVPAGVYKGAFYLYAHLNVPAGNTFYWDDVTIREVTAAQAVATNSQTVIDSIVQAVDGSTATGALAATVKTSLQKAWSHLWDGLSNSATAASTGKTVAELFDAAKAARIQANLGVTNSALAQGTANTANSYAVAGFKAGDNLLRNGSFEDTAFYQQVTGGVYSTDVARTGSRSLKIVGTGATPHTYLSSDLAALRYIPANPGDTFVFSVWVYGHASNVEASRPTGIRLGMVCYDKSMANPIYETAGFPSGTALNGTWTQYTAILPASGATTAFVNPYIQLINVPATETFYFDDAIFQRNTEVQTVTDAVYQAVNGGVSTRNAPGTVKTSLQKAWSNLWDGLSNNPISTSTGKTSAELFDAAKAARIQANLGVTNAALAQGAANTADGKAVAADGKAQNTIDSIVQAVDGSTTTGASAAATKTKLQTAWANLWDGLRGTSGATSKLPSDIQTEATRLRTDTNSASTAAANASTAASNTQLSVDVRAKDFQNLVAGSDFDTTTCPWNLEAGYFELDTTQFNSGTKSLKITAGVLPNRSITYGAGLAGGRAAYFEAKPGEQFYAEMWVRRSSDWTVPDGSGPRFRMSRGNGPSAGTTWGNFIITAAMIPTANTWTKISQTFTMPTEAGLNSTVFDFTGPASAATGTLWVDDIVVRRIPTVDAIPNLSASKVTTGTFLDTLIPNLNASKITAGEFGTARIADSAITSAKIINNAIDALKIAANAITEAKIADGAVTGVKTSVLDASKVTTGSMPQAQVTNLISDFVTTKNLARGTLASGANLVSNPGFEYTTFADKTFLDSTVKRTGARSIKTTANGTGYITVHLFCDDSTWLNIPANPDDVFYVEGYVYRSGVTPTTGSVWIQANAIDKTGAAISYPSTPAVAAAAVSTDANNWTKISGYIQMPANTASFSIHVVVGNTVTSGSVFHWDDCVVKEYTHTATLNRTLFNSNVPATQPTFLDTLIPGLNASKITAGEFGTARIADNAITGAKIIDNAIAAIKIQANAITEAKLADGAVTGNKIIDDAIEAIKIKANAITEAKLAANAVTETKLANGAVTGAKTAGLDASKITGGFMAQARVTNLVSDLLGIKTTADNATPFTDFDQLTDHIVNALTGSDEHQSRPLQETWDALVKAHLQMADNAQGIFDLRALRDAATSKGQVFNIAFSEYPDGALPTDKFTVYYSGAGTSQIGVKDGLAQWVNTNNADRNATVMWHAPTDTNFQIIRGTLSTPPQTAPGGGTAPRFVAIGRAGDFNANGPQTFVWARAYADGLFTYRGEIGCTVNGSEKIWKSDVPLLMNMQMTFDIGCDGNERKYRVYSGNSLVWEHTETGTNSQSGNKSTSTIDSVFGDNHRRVGAVSQIRGGTGGPRHGGMLRGFSVADNQAPEKAGSTGRIYRVSTTAIDFAGASADQTLINFFDRSDTPSLDITQNSASGWFRVRDAKPYILSARVKMSSGLSSIGYLVLQKSTTGTSGWTDIGYGNTGDVRANAAMTATWVQYLDAGVYVRVVARHTGSNVLGCLNGSANGMETQFSITGAG